jgi:DNA-binding CsgD family transcriptional regulator
MTPATCQEIIEALQTAGTVEEIHEICSRICTQYGFEHFAYVARIPVSLAKPYMCYVSGFPGEWRDRYLGLGYMQIDPVVNHCLKHVTPLPWDTVKPPEKGDKPVWQFMGEAREFGLKSGVSLPMHGGCGETALFSLTSNESPEKSQNRIRAALPYVYLISAYLHEAMRRVLSSELIDLNRAELTEREKECLLWAAEGKTSWETAQILHITERTVIFHLQNAAKKLNVVNRQHAIARAVVMGLITPQFG